MWQTNTHFQTRICLLHLDEYTNIRNICFSPNYGKFRPYRTALETHQTSL